MIDYFSFSISIFRQNYHKRLEKETALKPYISSHQMQRQLCRNATSIVQLFWLPNFKKGVIWKKEKLKEPL